MNDRNFKNIKILILDVDGILTDGIITYTNSGDELKSFSVKDGLGIRLLIDSGIRVAVATARESNIVNKRCKELGISPIYQGIKDKSQIFKIIQKEFDFKKDEIAFMGDDLIDIPLLNLCGLPITVPMACEEVKGVCLYTTKNNGGNGAVREVCEKLLKSKNLWISAISKFTKKTE